MSEHSADFLAALACHKEAWIADYTFYAGKQWGDPPISRAEAEAAWTEYYADMYVTAGAQETI